MKRILVDGGYISLDNGTYYFYITDHLGNNRTVVKADGNPAQRSHYYPFGMTFAEGTGQDSQPYKYNGKELDKMHGLNLYDYSARYYEPAIGRFTTVDPLAEKFYSISPYAYCNNNPLRFIDPTGMSYDDPPGGIIYGFFMGIEKKIDGLENLLTTFAHKGPVAVLEGMRPKSVGDALKMSADMLTLGAASTTSNLVNAVEADINGGNGYYTGEVLGGAAFDAAMTGAVVGGAQGVGSISKSGNKTNATKTVNNLTKYYPENGGALGEWNREFLMPGTKIDRIGSLNGKYFSPAGTPKEMRALPYENNSVANVFEVMKPFEVRSSTIAPAFGQIGHGTQYLSPVNAKTLLKRGIIKEAK